MSHICLLQFMFFPHKAYSNSWFFPLQLKIQQLKIQLFIHTWNFAVIFDVSISLTLYIVSHQVLLILTVILSMSYLNVARSMSYHLILVPVFFSTQRLLLYPPDLSSYSPKHLSPSIYSNNSLTFLKITLFTLFIFLLKISFTLP